MKACPFLYPYQANCVLPMGHSGGHHFDLQPVEAPTEVAELRQHMKEYRHMSRESIAWLLDRAQKLHAEIDVVEAKLHAALATIAAPVKEL